jgi:hypothetical protein
LCEEEALEGGLLRYLERHFDRVQAKFRGLIGKPMLFEVKRLYIENKLIIPDQLQTLL